MYILLRLCLLVCLLTCTVLCVAECPSRQVYSNCSAACPYTCEDLWPHTQCLPVPCTPGCTCPPGQVRTSLLWLCILSNSGIIVYNHLTVSLLGVVWGLLCASCRLSLLVTLFANWIPKLEHEQRRRYRSIAAAWNNRSAPLQHMVIHCVSSYYSNRHCYLHTLFQK